MKGVADTSPLNYLVQLGLVYLVHSLYGTILVPTDVLRELQDAKAPSAVRAWASQLPDWVSVQTVDRSLWPTATGLHTGERAAIALALQTRATLFLTDDRMARQAVEDVFGLKVIGTLGILRDAHIAGYIDGLCAFHRLCDETSFRLTPQIRHSFPELLKDR